MSKEKIKLTKYDMANYLTTEKEITAFLKASIEDNDPDYLPRALGIVARARGMTKVAKKAGVTRSSLYKAFSEGGNPEFSTVLKVLDALGLKFKITRA